MTLNPSFDLSRWTRFHYTCLILSIRSFSKVRSGGDAEAKADEIGSFLSERGPGTSHISASHAQEKKLRTFSLLLLGLGEFLLVLFFDFFFFFFHLDSHEVRNGESCWAGQAGRQLLEPPPLWSHRRILTLKVVQPLHPPTPGQEPQLQALSRRSTAPSPPPPPAPGPRRRCEGRAEEVKEGEPVNHLPTAECTRSSRGAEVAPRALLFWTHPLLLTSKWGCPHVRQYGAPISNSRFSKVQPASPGPGRAWAGPSFSGTRGSRFSFHPYISPYTQDDCVTLALRAIRGNGKLPAQREQAPLSCHSRLC